MAKKVFIGVGHGGTDPGAVGYIVEEDANLTMALACKELLEANGVTVKMSRTKDENDPTSEEIKECNAFNPDLAIDVHNNAGGGDGFEAYYSIVGGLGETLAKNIEAQVKAIGQNSRGVKTKPNKNGKDYYGFIRQTVCPAVILEGVFVDNATDVKIADTVAEQKALGYAYARGILKTLGITEKKVATKKTYSGTFPRLISAKGYLGKGDSGINVVYLQKFLNWYGNYKLATDGIFGNMTSAAVKKFQKAEKLTADGLFGSKSLAKAKAVKR